MSRAINTITAATAADGATNLNIDSGTLFVDTTTNNVGIGTTSPAAKLHASTSGASSIDETIRLDNSSNSASNGNKITWRNAGQTTECAFISGIREGSATSFGVAIGTSPNFTSGGTNAVERLRIDSSGNVGVANTTPSSFYAGANNLVIGSGSGEEGATIYGGNASASYLAFADGTTGDQAYRGSVKYDHSVDAISLQTGAAERLRIDSSGNVGIGTTSPTDPAAYGRALDIQSANGGIVYTRASGDTSKYGLYGFSEGNTSIGSFGTSTGLRMWTSGAERLRIDSSGNLLVGKTAQSTSTVGFQFTPSENKIACGAASGPSALFNRNTDDGIIVQLAQNGGVEGTISVAGTTVSYNGGHLSRFSQLPSGQRDPAIKKGTVMSNLNEMCEWRDKEGNLLPNEQLNKVKISDVEGDLNTAGVFVNWDNDDQDNPYDLNMAMTGDMIIRIAQGTIVNRGDLLISAGDGTAKPQGDDIIRSKTIAKVTSTNVTCTYEDGSYCVPCVLMAC